MMSEQYLTEEDINLGYEYCMICGKPMMQGEEGICEDCLWESSRPLTNEEIKVLEQSNDD